MARRASTRPASRSIHRPGKARGTLRSTRTRSTGRTRTLTTRPIAGLLAWRWLYAAGESLSPDAHLLSLFQIYFLSTPHRWITLVLVFCDSDRFWKEPAKFGGIGVGLVLGGLGLVAIAGILPFAT